MRAAALVLAATATLASAFVPAAPKASPPATQLAAKSKAVPFLEAPKALDGSLPADVGFDPLNLSDIDFDFTYLMVPTKWEESRTGLSALKWFRVRICTLVGWVSSIEERAQHPCGRQAGIGHLTHFMGPLLPLPSRSTPPRSRPRPQEAEIKHGRFAMLGVLGWIAVDMGIRLPFTKYAGYNAVQAHDAFVKSGDMTVGLLAIGFLEVVMGAAIYEMSKGSDRAPGQFEFGAWRNTICASVGSAQHVCMPARPAPLCTHMYTRTTHHDVSKPASTQPATTPTNERTHDRPPGPGQGPVQVRALPGVGDQERPPGHAGLRGHRHAGRAHQRRLPLHELGGLQSRTTEGTFN